MKIYSYNGFGKPVKIADSVEELATNVVVKDNYLGDKTLEMVEEIESFIGKEESEEVIQELNEILDIYNIIVNPTLEDLVGRALSWFDKNSIPYEHFEDFGTKQEVNKYL